MGWETPATRSSPTLACTAMLAFRSSLLAAISSSVAWVSLAAQATGRPPADAQQAVVRSVLLRPARVFDGVTAEPHAGWVVLVTGEKIAAVGAAADVRAPAGATTVDLPNTTLLPGLIEGHSHLLLHP